MFNSNDDSGLFGLIIILALLGGVGGGFGFGGGNYSEVQRGFDNQAVISKLDQQTYGLADSTYALNNSITNGFHGVDNQICNLGYNVQSGFNALAHQVSDCCCTTQRAIDGINYNMATQACETRQAIADSTKSILDFIVNDKLATLQAENQSLKLRASQVEQNAYLIGQLRPCPIPAYTVANPFCCPTTTTTSTTSA